MEKEGEGISAGLYSCTIFARSPVCVGILPLRSLRYKYLREGHQGCRARCGSVASRQDATMCSARVHAPRYIVSVQHTGPDPVVGPPWGTGGESDQYPNRARATEWRGKV